MLLPQSGGGSSKQTRWWDQLIDFVLCLKKNKKNLSGWVLTFINDKITKNESFGPYILMHRDRFVSEEQLLRENPDLVDGQFEICHYYFHQLF